jgi:hypothetical protein
VRQKFNFRSWTNSNRQSGFKKDFVLSSKLLYFPVIVSTSVISEEGSQAIFFRVLPTQ